MKKYNMPTMEISLFDAEVVSTNQTTEHTSDDMANFTAFQNGIDANGIARTIYWDKLEFTY